MDRIVVSAYEARQMLGTSPNRLQRLLESGELAAYKDGRNWKIPITAIKEYAESKAQEEAKKRRSNGK